MPFLKNLDSPYRWYWLSFANNGSDEMSVSNAFLGACAVYAREPIEALAIAWELKINPGGEVLFQEINPQVFDRVFSPERVNRLLKRSEAKEVVTEIDACGKELGLRPVYHQMFKKPREPKSSAETPSNSSEPNPPTP